MDSTRTDPPSLISLLSPFNGETITMQFLPGVPPTLETMLKAGYTRVKPDKPTQKESRDGTRKTDGH